MHSTLILARLEQDMTTRLSVASRSNKLSAVMYMNSVKYSQC